jgi:hypothetical protein
VPWRATQAEVLSSKGVGTNPNRGIWGGVMVVGILSVAMLPTHCFACCRGGGGGVVRASNSTQLM